MAEIILLPSRALDSNGDPVNGAVALFYEAGTSTPLTVYTDSGLGTPHGTSVTADSSGIFAQAWTADGQGVKVDIQTSGGSSISSDFPEDNFPTLSDTSTTASSIVFTPVTGNAATDVQGGIANNTADILLLENMGYAPVTGGTSSAYTLTPTNALTAYAAGNRITFRPDQANAGACTINVSGLGAKSLKKWDGGTLSEIAGSALQADEIHEAVYNGTDFVLISPTIAGTTRRGLVQRSTSAENIAGTNTGNYASVAGIKEMIDEHATMVKSSDGTQVASTSASLDFTGFDATKFTSYELIFANLVPATDAVNLIIRFSTDGGSTFISTGTYSYHIASTGTSVTSTGNTGTATGVQINRNTVGSAAGEDGVSGRFTIPSPDLSKKTHIMGTYQMETAAGAMEGGVVTGSESGTTAVDAVQILYDSGNIESGEATLYCIR